jgi:Tfp pilus assembly protein PilF/TolB-like protein
MRSTVMAPGLLALSGCAMSSPAEPTRSVATAGPLAVIVVPFDASDLPAERRWLGTGIAEVVSLGLVEHPTIVQLDRARVTALSDAATWTEDTVRRVARAAHAHAALYGRVQPDAGGLVVSPRVLDLRTGQVTSLPALRTSDLELLLRLTTVPVLYARELQPGATDALSPRIAKAAHPTGSLRAFELFSRGQVAFDHGDAEEAVRLVLRAVEADPQFAVAQYRLGVAHVALGNLWKAAAQVRAAWQIDRMMPEPYKALGDLFLGAPRQLVEQAIEAYSKAIELRPFYADAHVGLGDTRTAKGDADGARAAYEKALTFDPFKAGTHVKLGRIFASRGLCNAAEREYERARELDPRSPDVRCAE